MSANLNKAVKKDWYYLSTLKSLNNKVSHSKVFISHINVPDIQLLENKLES